MSLAPDLLGLFAGVALFAIGALRLRARRGRAVVEPRSVVLFGAGAAVLLLAFAPPLHGAAHALVSAHMIQHMLVMTLAAPLLVLARPFGPMLFALPRALARPLGRALAPRALQRPEAAMLLNGIVLWIWHMPGLYDLALAHPMLHWAEHLTMLGAACLFWHVLLVRAPRRPQGHGEAALALLATLMHAGLLGALLTFAPRPLFAAHRDVAAFGLDPLVDQQLAGLIMWVPGCATYLVAALACCVLWLRGLDARPLPVDGELRP